MCGGKVFNPCVSDRWQTDQMPAGKGPGSPWPGNEIQTMDGNYTLFNSESLVLNVSYFDDETFVLSFQLKFQCLFEFFHSGLLADLYWYHLVPKGSITGLLLPICACFFASLPARAVVSCVLFLGRVSILFLWTTYQKNAMKDFPKTEVIRDQNSRCRNFFVKIINW